MFEKIDFRRERGIRTPGTLTSTSDFESDPFDHSGSSLVGAAKLRILTDFLQIEVDI